jgi:hypothetical protein
MSVLAITITALLLLIAGFVVGVVFGVYISKAAPQEDCDTNPQNLELPIYSWEPNDFGVYRTVGDAEINFEPWIVEHPVEFFDGTGQILRVEPVHKTHAIRLYVDDSKPPEPERLAQIIRDFVAITKGINLPPQLSLTELNTYVLINEIGG